MANVTLDKNGLAKASGMLTIFNYSSLTGEFLSTTNEYLPQGVGLPAFACADAPPQVNKGEVAIYRNGCWLAVADHRGETVYDIADGSAMVITELGDYPAGMTLLAPVTSYDQWDGAQWVTNEDAQHAANVSEADNQKSLFINEANRVTQAWQTQLMLGIITDKDKAALTEWMKYIQQLQALDISDPPGIEWPATPK